MFFGSLENLICLAFPSPIKRYTRTLSGLFLLLTIGVFFACLSPQFAHAALANGDGLWVATQDGLTKLALDDGRILAQPPDTKKLRHLAFDEIRTLLWAFGKRKLSAFDSAGQLQRTIDLSFLGGTDDDDDDEDDDDDDEGTSHPALAVDSSTGDVWLALNKRLHHFDLHGVFLQTIDLADHVQQLAFDPLTNRLWVATDRSVTAYDPAGVALLSLALNPQKGRPHVNAIAVDRLSGNLWVALEDSLRLYNSTGSLLLQRTALNRMELLADDGAHGVWAARGRRLMRISAAGQVLINNVSLPHRVSISALVGDPRDHSVWAGGERTVAHISAGGQLLLEISLSKKLRALALGVPPPNQPPVAINDAALTNQGVAVSIPVLANDSDPDGDPLTITSVTQGTNGSVTHTITHATYTPNPAFGGTDSFTYTISDGKGGQATASVTVTVNKVPVANDDLATTVMNTPVDIDVLANDSDPDGDPQTVAGASQPANGTTLVNANNTIRYTPNSNFIGLDSFTYTISDGRGGTAGATVRVAVTSINGCLPPAITSFSPGSGSVGAEVTITGANLDCGPNRTLALNGAPLVVSSATPTQIKTFIPIGAQSGTFSITTEAGIGIAPTPITVVSSSDFALTVSPTTGRLIQGSSSSYSINLQSIGGQPFTGLADLSLTGLPSGVTASFSPATITGGQRGMLTVTAQSNATLGTAPLTLSATATIDAKAVVKTSNFDLTILQGNRSVLQGQFMLKDGPPMPGVVLKLISQLDGSILAQTDSDAGGNFLFLDPPAGVLTLSVDTTPFDPTRPFPIYGVDVTIIAGTATVLPVFTITPPPPPQAFVPIQNATQDQVVTNPQIPGVSIKLPAGATVTGWDGLVKNKITIVKLSPDELPMTPPPGPTRSLYQFNFGTSMGGIPSVPLPVTLPNDQGLNPGEKAEIWFYDAAPFVGAQGTWKKAGLGTVSQDGSVVASDPGVGIDRFCGVCGTACIIRQQQGQANRNTESPTGGDPINLALGQMIEEKTDLVLPGRIPAVIHRTYNPFDPFGSIAGFQLGLGAGWGLSVEAVLLEVTSSLRRVVLPGNARFEFALQGIGSFVNTTHSRFAGAVLTTEAGGTHRLRFKDGTVWRFTCCWVPRTGGKPIAGLGLLVEQADRNGNRLIINRDAFGGGVTSIVEPAGRSLVFSADSSGRITTVTDPIGRTVRYGYNTSGRLDTVTNPAGGITRYTYDSAGRIISIADPRGITFLTNEYDATGRVFRQNQADGGVWTFQYQGLPSATTGVILADPRGNSTTHKFNSAASASETVDALGQITKFTRDDKGQVVATTDPLGRVSRFEYDAVGNVTKITDPAGNNRAFEYEPIFNRLTKLTDPLGNVTQFAYDTKGNLIKITDPLGNLTQIAYNQFGQPVSTNDPLGNLTRFQYDGFGNLTKVIGPLGNSSRRAYDAVSRLIAQTDPRGRTTKFTYDQLNRIKDLEDAIKGLTSFTYDGNGNLLTVADARNNSTTHTYDSMDRLATRTDPVKATESFQYDQAGNLTRHTDRKGLINAFTYDALNRRIGGNYADGTTTTFTHDSVGRLVQAADSLGGTILNSYDNLDRLNAQTTGLGLIQYTYDVLGRRSSMTVTGQPTVNYSYDQNSRLVQIVQGTQVVDFNYDALGRRTKLTLPNGVSTEYLYDTASRLTQLIYRNATSVLGNLTYQYDTAGNRTSVGGSFAQTLLPDPVSTANYDSANRQLQFGNKTMTFDTNGNLTLMTEPSGLTRFTWDARNRLTALATAGTMSFTYDGLERRSGKQLLGTLTRYLYDGFDSIAEVTGGHTRNYIRAPTVDEPLVRNGTEYYLADALGSILALTDGTGTMLAEYSYQPFGVTNVRGVTSNPFQYTARENDLVEIYYYRSRYYSPVLHRFISEDPLRYPGVDVNPYMYVGNNPVAFTDPSGLKKNTPGCGTGFKAGFGSAYPGETVPIIIPPQVPGSFRKVLHFVHVVSEMAKGAAAGVEAVRRVQDERRHQKEQELGIVIAGTVGAESIGVAGPHRDLAEQLRAAACGAAGAAAGVGLGIVE